jgi:hypothetical protein
MDDVNQAFHNLIAERKKTIDVDPLTLIHNEIWQNERKISMNYIEDQLNNFLVANTFSYLTDENIVEYNDIINYIQKKLIYDQIDLNTFETKGFRQYFLQDHKLHHFDPPTLYVNLAKYAIDNQSVTSHEITFVKRDVSNALKMYDEEIENINKSLLNALKKENTEREQKLKIINKDLVNARMEEHTIHEQKLKNSKNFTNNAPVLKHKKKNQIKAFFTSLCSCFRNDKNNITTSISVDKVEKVEKVEEVEKEKEIDKNKKLKNEILIKSQEKFDRIQEKHDKLKERVIELKMLVVKDVENCPFKLVENRSLDVFNITNSNDNPNTIYLNKEDAEKASSILMVGKLYDSHPCTNVYINEKLKIEMEDEIISYFSRQLGYYKTCIKQMLLSRQMVNMHDEKLFHLLFRFSKYNFNPSMKDVVDELLKKLNQSKIIKESGVIIYNFDTPSQLYDNEENKKKIKEYSHILMSNPRRNCNMIDQLRNIEHEYNAFSKEYIKARSKYGFRLILNNTTKIELYASVYKIQKMYDIQNPLDMYIKNGNYRDVNSIQSQINLSCTDPEYEGYFIDIQSHAECELPLLMYGNLLTVKELKKKNNEIVIKIRNKQKELLAINVQKTNEIFPLLRH